jgi:hypothetical protein
MRHVADTQKGSPSSILVRPWSSELRGHASFPPVHVEMTKARLRSWRGRDGWGLHRSGRSPETAIRTVQVFRPAGVTASVVWLALSLRSRSGGSIESQIFIRQMQIILKNGNDERVVLALRQTGYGDCADAPCSGK